MLPLVVTVRRVKIMMMRTVLSTLWNFRTWLYKSSKTVRFVLPEPQYPEPYIDHNKFIIYI
jgi:hypothetical protein